ncbi:hypothetical protein GCM10022293_60050 [Azospirillum formosense]
MLNGAVFLPPDQVLKPMINNEMGHTQVSRPIPKVASVSAEPEGRILQLHWMTGEKVRVDLAIWITVHDIAELRDDAVFRRPEIGEDGSSVQ